MKKFSIIYFFVILIISGCEQKSFTENQVELKNNIFYEKNSKIPLTGKLILKYNTKQIVHECDYINGKLEEIKVLVD